MVVFINQSKSLETKDILEIEQKLSVEIPKYLKEFYLFTNGGEIKDDKCIFIDKNGNDYNIKTFLPMKYRRFEDDILFEELTIHFISKKLLQSNFLVFAIDWGGFPFCYNVDDDAIYFYDLDIGNVLFLANSIREFLMNITTEEEAF
ncbi:SMI1/KNR4 family protein [Capnocytophaga canimorsus]|uniref:SMI1/KNR4 family protein n=1 Tax=Capnocytophaga canimorsus TaxID=28188 RepID=UPI0037D844FD